MDSLFSELRSAREAKNLSLADIASATNISTDFLVAIEEGRTEILPQTYVRAFLREYAEVVGLDPLAIMRTYDELRNSPARGKTVEGVRSGAPPTPPTAHTKQPTPGPPRSRTESRPTIAIIGVLIVLAAILYWNISRPRIDPTEERPTQEHSPPKDTFRQHEIPNPPPARFDSLFLSSQTSDTVWVRIVKDSKDTLNYLFRPNSKRSWKARESFSISLGNAGVIEFTLNNVPMGRLGKRGSLVRDSLITRRTLIALQRK